MTTATAPATSTSQRSLETIPYPVAFPAKAAHEAAASTATPYHLAIEGAYRSEVMALGKFQKEGLVENIATGRTWRLAADEGKYLRGTDLAPAPLMHWGTGLVSDVTLRIAALAKANKLAFERLSVVARQGFASKGSFVKGEAVGLVFGLTWTVDLTIEAEHAVVDHLVQLALAGSPLVDAMTATHEGGFALYTNGRRTVVEGVRASVAAPEADPYVKYSKPPRPTAEPFDARLLTQLAGVGSVDFVLKNDSQVAVGWHMQAAARYDVATGLVHSTVDFPEATGSGRWTLVSDGEGQRAPSPVAYFSIGTAFCYHTQLCRYIEVRHLPVDGPRLVQTTHFSAAGSGGPSGHGESVDTQLFINGRASEADTRSLLAVAANTCYAHRALETSIEMRSTQGPIDIEGLTRAAA